MKSVIPMLVWWVLVGGGDAPTERTTEDLREAFVAESVDAGEKSIRLTVPVPDTLEVTRELLRRYAEVANTPRRQPDMERCDAHQGHVCFPSVAMFFQCDAGRPCDHANALSDFIAFVTEAAAENPDAGFALSFATFSTVRLGNENVASDLVSRCDVQDWLCQMLDGYVAHATGDYLAAEQQLRSALAMAPDSVRCEFVQPNRALVGGHRRSLNGADCAEREAVADTVWWLADPLYASGPNDRFTAHIARTFDARLLIVLVHTAGDDRRRFTHDHIPGAYREAHWDWHVPRGHPDSWRGGEAHSRPALQALGLIDAWTSPPASRYHFVPDFEGEGFGNPTWRLEAELADEGYTPSYGTFHEVPTQVARFRGGGAMQVAVAGTLTGSGMEGSGEPHLILSDAPGSFPVREVAEADGPESRFLTEIPFERHVLSHEVLGDREFGRYRIMLESLDHEGAGISDLLLFRAQGGDPPLELEEAVARMQAGTRIDAGSEVGVYWETYGVESDRPVEFEVTLEGERRGGILGTLRRLLPGGGPDTPVRMGWSETPHAGTHHNGVTIDLSELDPGSYTLVVRVEWEGSDGPVEARRVVRVGS